jgi:hypothetical protein
MRLAILGVLALAFAAPAQAEDPLFAASAPIQLTIRAPLGKLIRNRESKEVIAGTLVDPAGQSLPVGIALRGITRRTHEICEFPPLRVDFTTPPPAASVFAGQKRLKLVTHCRSSAAAQQLLLLEYAAYGMYNAISPRSFRARLATINYQDADGRPIIARTGFFLEDVKGVAKRNDMREIHAPALFPFSYLVPADAARYAMFEQMIGNHDWSMRAGPPGEDCCHNAKLIGTRWPGMVVPIPYDFDFSGLVDAPYAFPPETLNLGNVRQRKYRGFCVHNGEALGAARQMLGLRPQIMAALARTPGLEPRTLAKAGAYLDGFFAAIGSDADVQRKVLGTCLS